MTAVRARSLAVAAFCCSFAACAGPAPHRATMGSAAFEIAGLATGSGDAVYVARNRPMRVDLARGAGAGLRVTGELRVPPGAPGERIVAISGRPRGGFCAVLERNDAAEVARVADRIACYLAPAAGGRAPDETYDPPQMRGFEVSGVAVGGDDVIVAVANDRFFEIVPRDAHHGRIRVHALDGGAERSGTDRAIAIVGGLALVTDYDRKTLAAYPISSVGPSLWSLGDAAATAGHDGGPWAIAARDGRLAVSSLAADGASDPQHVLVYRLPISVRTTQLPQLEHTYDASALGVPYASSLALGAGGRMYVASGATRAVKTVVLPSPKRPQR